jgi:hypothetical protein
MAHEVWYTHHSGCGHNHSEPNAVYESQGTIIENLVNETTGFQEDISSHLAALPSYDPKVKQQLLDCNGHILKNTTKEGLI